MDADSPAQVRELGSVRPRVRPDLRFIFQEFGGERCCVVEDPVTSKFHRVGLAEYRFIRQLDGRVTFNEAFARAALESGTEALTEREAIGVVSWLVDHRLADLGGGIPDQQWREAQGKRLSARLHNVLNFLFVKVPLGRPDALLARLYPVFKFLCGWGFFPIWLLAGVAGISQVAVNWERFARGTEGVLSPHNWFWLLVVWVGLKVWHECWHGLVCRHHGGRVREAGVLLVLFVPLGYVDATSSLAFPSKWRRMHVAAAGMYGEFFLAALAAVFWAHTGPGIANTLALNVMVMASVVTLLFNLNPLMRFDGYFLLVDLLEKPNLYTRAQRLVQTLAKRWLLGLDETPPAWGESGTWLHLAYGLAALLWRLFVVAALLAAATRLFHGGGLLFAVVALGFLLLPPVRALAGLLRGRPGQERPRVWVAGLRCGLLTVGLLVLALFPFRLNLTTPGLVRYAGEIILRAEGPGFVTGIHCADGALVEEGALLVTLDNPEQENRLDRLAFDHRRQDLRRRLALLDRSPAEYEAEGALLASLRDQYLQQLRYVETLDVVAPRAGRVVAPQLADLPGRFMHTGDEILRVADPVAVEVVIPIAQDDVDAFRRHLGRPVRVYIEGRASTWSGRLERISGRASTDLETPALSTLAGGPLAVKPRETAAGARDEAYELVSPHFWGDITLTAPVAEGLRAGERVRIKFRGEQGRSLGERARTRFLRLIDHVFTGAA